MASDNRAGIRARREGAKLSIRRLEDLTGINRGRLSILERGVEPTAAELEAIETALAGVEGGRLVSGSAKLTVVPE